MRLAKGDYGVRKITKVKCNVSVGAICALVIVKPLCSVSSVDIGTPNEIDYMIDKGGLIPIHNDAYLNFCIFDNAASAQIPSIHGYVQTIWEA